MELYQAAPQFYNVISRQRIVMFLTEKEVKGIINKWFVDNCEALPVIERIIAKDENKTMLALLKRTKAPVTNDFWIVTLENGDNYFVNDVTGNVHNGYCDVCKSKDMPEDCIICWIRGREKT